MRSIIVIVIVGCLVAVNLCYPLQSSGAGEAPVAQFGTKEPTGAFVFSKKGDVLIAAGGVKENDKYVLLRWDLKRKVPMKHIETDFDTYVESLDQSPDGKSLLAVDGNGNVAVFSDTGEQLAKFRLFEKRVNRILDVKFRNDEEVLTISRQSVIECRNFRTKHTKLYYISGRPPKGATFVVNANALLWVNDRTVCMWSPMLREASDPIEVFAPENRYSRIVSCGDRATALCATSDSEMGLIDIRKGDVTKTWNAHGHDTLAALIPLSQRRAYASASECGDIKLWNSMGEMVGAANVGDSQIVYGMASNHDSTLLAVGTKTRVVVLEVKEILERNSKSKK
jgi:WD40 repeat protein